MKKFFAEIPYKEIWSLVWPQVLMMTCTLVISLTDIWVGGKINSDVQASIGIAAQLQAFFMVIGTSLGPGAMATLSQSIGAKRFQRAKRFTNLILIYAICMAFIIGFLGYLCRYPIMDILQVPGDITPLAITFFIFIMCALPAQYVMTVSGMLFRANKNVIHPLIIMSITAIINVIGNFCLGLGYFGFPALGGMGIALSTFLSVNIGALLALYYMVKLKLTYKKMLPSLRWVSKAIPYLVKVTVPAITMQSLWQIGYLILFSITASLPNSVNALAGMTTGMRVESILFMPAMAFNVTASIMVGNALGAGNIQEAKRIGLAIIFFGASMLSLLGLAFYPFVDLISQAFSTNPDTQWNTATYLLINIASTPFTVGSVVVNGIMNGAGATKYALYINSFCVWCVRLPLAYILAHFMGFGPAGVYVAMLVSMMAQASSMFYVFLKRPWYKHTLRKIKNA